MSKKRYFNNKFLKSQALETLRPSASLTSDFGDLKLRDLWQNQTLKNQV